MDEASRIELSVTLDPDADDRVTVHYAGWNDGGEFDSFEYSCFLTLATGR